MDWQTVYKGGSQGSNKFFPEQFLLKFFFSETFKYYLKEMKVLNLLDIGSGYGRNISLYQEFSNDITCIDPSESCIEFIKKNYLIKAQTFNPPVINLNEKFDMISCCNSIYYLGKGYEFDTYFQNIIDLLNDNGVIFFSFIGNEHSILNNAQKNSRELYTINSENNKFKARNGLKVYVPEKFEVKKFKLEIISSGNIKDDFDGNIRHLKVYMCKKKL